jgi:hypothetical protein
MTDSLDSPVSPPPAVVFGHEFDLATLGRPADEFERRFVELLTLASDNAHDWYGIEDASVTGNWSLVTHRELRQCRQREQERMFGRMIVPNDPTRDARDGDDEPVTIPADARPSGGVVGDRPRASTGAGEAGGPGTPSESGESTATSSTSPQPPSSSSSQPSITPPAEREPPRTSFEDETIHEREIVKRIKLDVLGKLPGGAIKVFSLYHRRTEIIRNIGKMTYEDLLQIAGPPAREYVIKSIQDDLPDVYSFAEVREAIAILAGFRTIGDQTELGVGCWEGVENARDGEMSVVLVGAGEAAYWNGDKKLYRIDYPRAKGHLLDFESGEESWYDYERLAKLMDTIDGDEARKIMLESVSLFGRWKWKSKSIPMVATGLVFASFVQSIWEHRPQVAVIGESNSGKSYLWIAMERLLGKLCSKMAKPTEAGLRQSIGNDSRIVLIDEFDKIKNRASILELIRSSSRGDKVTRGTPGQKVISSTIKNIVWVAGIEAGLIEEADRNRFITLDLVKPPREESGNLQLPTVTEAAELGEKMLAVAIKSIQQAKPLAVKLRDTHVEGIDARIVESYAVPIAMIATILEHDEHKARELLIDVLSGLDRQEVEVDSDKDSLMRDILGSHIQSGPVKMTVGQWLKIVLRREQKATEAENVLAGYGIKVSSYTDEDSGRLPSDALGCQPGDQCIVIAHTNVHRLLLRGTSWEGKSIDKIITRIPGAMRARRRIGGVKLHSVMVPMLYLNEHVFSDTETDESEPVGF